MAASNQRTLHSTLLARDPNGDAVLSIRSGWLLRPSAAASRLHWLLRGTGCMFSKRQVWLSPSDYGNSSCVCLVPHSNIVEWPLPRVRVILTNKSVLLLDPGPDRTINFWEVTYMALQAALFKGQLASSSHALACTIHFRALHATQPFACLSSLHT